MLAGDIDYEYGHDVEDKKDEDREHVHDVDDDDDDDEVVVDDDDDDVMVLMMMI